jgi:IS30 family transposase
MNAKRGEAHYAHKLTVSDVRQIVRLSKTMTNRQIARAFNVAFTTVNAILVGRNWRWLTGIKRTARTRRVPARRAIRHRTKRG